MKYLYIAFVSLITVLALAWVIHLGIQGKPVAKIKLSEFTSTKDLSESVQMRLRQELKDHGIVFLGVDPDEPEHLVVWKQFLQDLNEPGWKFDEIFIEQGLGLKETWGLGEKVIDIKKEEAALKLLWASEVYKDKRIAVVVPHVYSSQLIKDNPVQRVKASPEDARVLSLTIVPLAQSEKEDEIARVPCAAEGADYTGQSPLGCVIRNKAMFWRKELKSKTRLGIVEQFGLHDYLIFYRPLR